MTLAATLVPAAARATTFVAMPDEALATQSPVIVVGRVLSSETGLLARAATDYGVEVLRVLKGSAPETLVVRVAGGRSTDGTYRYIDGAPRLAIGARAVLFLERRADGTYGILQYMLGAFREEAVGGQTLAVRDLSEATELGADGRVVEPHAERARDFDAFVEWLAQLDGGAAVPARDYVVDVPAPRRAVQPFNFFDGGSGFAPRWFAWDAGGTNTWVSHVSGQVGNPGAATQMQAALAAWNNDTGSRINMVYGGTTTTSASIDVSDLVNLVLWDDPWNDIAGSFSCSAGGVLALGGPNWSGPLTTFNGTSYWRISEGDVVTQDGVGCAFAGSGGANGAEVLTHEIGHAIGLRHSCEQTGSPCDTTDKNEATMRWSAHFDGRGAVLGNDDRAAIALMYKDPSPTVSVVLPNGGEIWSAGSSHIVGWNATNTSASGRFEIVLNNNGARTNLGTVTGSLRRFTWAPVPLPTTALAKIEVNYFPTGAGGSVAATRCDGREFHDRAGGHAVHLTHAPLPPGHPRAHVHDRRPRVPRAGRCLVAAGGRDPSRLHDGHSVQRGDAGAVLSLVASGPAPAPLDDVVPRVQHDPERRLAAGGHLLLHPAHRGGGRDHAALPDGVSAPARAPSLDHESRRVQRPSGGGLAAGGQRGRGHSPQLGRAVGGRGSVKGLGRVLEASVPRVYGGASVKSLLQAHARRAASAVLAWTGLLALAGCAVAPAPEVDVTDRLVFGTGAALTPGAAYDFPRDGASIFVVPDRVVTGETLRLTFDELTNVDSVHLYYDAPGRPFSALTLIPGLLDREHGTVAFRLGQWMREPTHVRMARVDFETLKDGVRVRVLKAVLVRERWASRFHFHPESLLLALGMSALILLPGTLIFVIARPILRWEAAWLPFSVLFYLAVYVVLDVVGGYGLGLQAPNGVYAAVVVGGHAALLWAARSRRPAVAACLRENRGALLAYLALTAVVCLVLTADHPEPLLGYSYRHVASTRTFGLCGAHDNYFQYVNAEAIANGEPFARYYGNWRLVYDVTAREMLPGVLYSVGLRTLRAVVPGVADSFLLYTFFGVSLNLAALFPLVALVRRYHPSVSAAPLAFAVFANAFSFVSAYYTWFKAPGVALFLAGLLTVLESSDRVRAWLWAGLLFGLGCNMHAATALAIPVFLAWLGLRHLRRGPGSLAQRVAAPAALAIVCVLCLLPWSVVKRTHLHPDNALIVEHFFENNVSVHRPDGGLGTAWQRLWAAHPLREQLAVRSRRVWEATRFREAADAFRPRTPIRDWLVDWTRYETMYPAVLLYPLGLLVLLARLAGPGPGPLDDRRRERRFLLGMCLLADALVVFASYSPHSPDLNWHLPMAMILLTYALLAARVLEARRAVRWAFFVYLALAVMRLVLLSVINPASEYFAHV